MDAYGTALSIWVNCTNDQVWIATVDSPFRISWDLTDLEDDPRDLQAELASLIANDPNFVTGDLTHEDVMRRLQNMMLA